MTEGHKGRSPAQRRKIMLELRKAGVLPEPMRGGPRGLAGAWNEASDGGSVADEPWGLMGLYDVLNAQGVPMDAALHAVGAMRRGRGIAPDLNPYFDIHERTVREALARGEAVSADMAQLHPRLLPEADPMYGLDAESPRLAQLVREHIALGNIGFNDSRSDYGANRWLWNRLGVVSNQPGKAEATAWDALKAYWRDRPWKSSLLDRDGPLTLAEQEDRLNAEAARLARRYEAVGLPRPRHPVAAEGMLQVRRFAVDAFHEEQAGLSDAGQYVRQCLRDATEQMVRAIHMQEREAFHARIPAGDPDYTPHEQDVDSPAEDHFGWALDELNAIQAKAAADPDYEREFHAALKDEAFRATLDPWVLQEADQLASTTPGRPDSGGGGA